MRSDSTAVTSSASAGSPVRRRRAGWICAGSAAGVLVAGGITVGVLNATVFTPEAVVEEYLDALSAGDGPRAFGLAQAGFAGSSAAGVSTALLDGDPLASTVEHLDDVEVSTDEDEADGTAVTVEFSVDGEQHSTRFAMEHAGHQWLVFDQWQMQPLNLQQVQLQPSGLPENSAADAPVAQVNKVDVPLTGKDAESSSSFAVLPPAAVHADYQGSYVAATEPSVAVIGNGTGGSVANSADSADSADRQPMHELGLQLGATDALTEEIQRQITEHLKFCTDQQVLQPTGCPMRYQTTNRVEAETIQWSIPQPPQILLDNAHDAAEISIGGVEAVARIELDEIDLMTGEVLPISEDIPFELSADLTVTPERVVVSPELN